MLTVAGVQARAQRRRVLVSLCERVPALDPLVALETVGRATASDRRLAAHVAAGRMYWTRARDGFALAGLGAVATFAPEGADRFASVDRAWNTLLDGAVIGGADEAAPGRGPTLMGGFAFEPEGPRSETWHGFPGAHLIVPRLLIASVGGECWSTISATVGPDSEPDVAPAELAELCRAAVPASAPAGEASVPADRHDRALAFSSPMEAAAWRALVRRGVAAIRAGELQKVVLARAVRAIAPSELNVVAMLRHLREAHGECLVFGYWRGERAFVGASPERLARLDGRRVQASILAGSAKRGATPQEDAALAAALLASLKDGSEHAVVRDALRQGLAELCDDVSVPDSPSLLTLRHVHHLHTAVRATLRPAHSLFDVVARLHPTPAVGGTPRDAALQFIRRHERLDRGWYAAPIGWVGRESGEIAVALRSAVISGSEATLFAGCGIVIDSDPEREFAESLLKLRPMQAALAAARGAAFPDASSDQARATAGAEQSS